MGLHTGAFLVPPQAPECGDGISDLLARRYVDQHERDQHNYFSGCYR